MSLIVPLFFVNAQTSEAKTLFPEAEEQSEEVFQLFDEKREQASYLIRSHSTWKESFNDLVKSYKERLDRHATEASAFYGTYAYTRKITDDKPIGVLRRVNKSKYKKAQTENKLDDLKWEEWLDLDTFVKSIRILGKIDKPDLGDLKCYFNPVSRERERCLIVVNQSGSDKNVFYEYDINNQRFVKDGFNFEIFGQHRVNWVNSDTISLRADLWAIHNFNHPKDQIDDVNEAIRRGLVSSAGSPLSTYLWKRGEKFDPRSPLISTKAQEAFTWIYTGLPTYGKEAPLDVILVGSTLSRIAYRIYYKTDFDEDGVYSDRTRINLPDEIQIIGLLYDGTLIVKLNQKWREFKEEDIIGIKLQRLGQSVSVEPPYLIHRPDTPKEFISDISLITNTDSVNDDFLIMLVMENVNHKVVTLKRTGAKTWRKPKAIKFPGLPKEMSAKFVTNNEHLTVTVESFTTPPATYELTAKDQEGVVIEKISQQQAKFDSEKYKIAQLWVDRGFDKATGRAVRVPYYVVYDPSKVSLENNSVPQKTLMTAYAGHGVRTGPNYLGTTYGAHWLERGGVYVLANPRGGGEFGQWWYEMSIGVGQKDRTEDFNAVAEDLIERGIAEPKTLGAFGGSNGGLLMGQVVTQRPDLYGAVQINIPLLDMMRYHIIGDGRAAGYINEWGDPEGAEREFWLEHSPLHALEAGVQYPKIMLFANRYDDRTHPAHARKFSLRLDELGVDHYMMEWGTGGHGGASAAANELIEPWALRLVFFHKALGVE